MIQPQELRIGNLVKVNFTMNPEREKLTRIEWVDFQIIGESEDSSSYSPIPLTEEWLMKAGFVGNEFKVFRLNDFKIGLNGDDIVHQQYTCIYKQAISLKVKSLHQLQNLYYCLCGKELEINT